MPTTHELASLHYRLTQELHQHAESQAPEHAHSARQEAAGIAFELVYHYHAQDPQTHAYEPLRAAGIKVITYCLGPPRRSRFSWPGPLIDEPIDQVPPDQA